ncbi:MAG: RimK/LysX family protein [Actinobacteria bacterium]|nr:RimK/LysX family protein [Actinomycetota bacterium]
MLEPDHPSTVAGWREWVSLPKAKVRWIKAKLDTGAKSSAIHAFDIEPFERGGAEWVRFAIHPWQRRDDEAIVVTSPILDRRIVRSSSGHEEERIAVPMVVRLVGRRMTVEMTLSKRDEMGFRMLLGREALSQGFLIDPAQSYAGPRPRRATRQRNWGR